MQAWKMQYISEFPLRAARAEFFITRPGPPAKVYL